MSCFLAVCHWSVLRIALVLFAPGSLAQFAIMRDEGGCAASRVVGGENDLSGVVGAQVAGSLASRRHGGDAAELSVCEAIAGDCSSRLALELLQLAGDIEIA